ncbi:MAG: S8 family serine peptidase [Patescibacteria group bacterium]
MLNLSYYFKTFAAITALTIVGVAVYSSINVEAYDSVKESSFNSAIKAVENSKNETSTLIKLKPNPNASKAQKAERITQLVNSTQTRLDYQLPNLDSFVVKADKAKLLKLKSNSTTAQAVEYNSYPAPALPATTNSVNTQDLDTSIPTYHKGAGITSTSSRKGYTGANQVVGVIDTGVDFSNVELSGKAVNEACFSDLNKEYGIKSYSLCPNGTNSQIGIGASKPCTGLAGCDHGSHVSGIAAGRASTRNHEGIAPEAKIVAVNVFHIVENTEKCTPKPKGKFKDFDYPKVAKCIYTSNFAYLKALDFMLDQNQTTPLAAVNMSLGTSDTKPDNCDDAETLNFHAIINAGIPLVIAAGNSYDKNQMSHPACQSRVISVGAYDEAFKTDLGFSNVSKNTTIFAPGFQVKSIGIKMSGTSMAAPIVAGSAALLRQSGVVGHENVKSRITSTGNSFTTKSNTAARSLNIEKMLSNQVQNPVTPTPSKPAPVEPTPKPVVPKPVDPKPTPAPADPNPTTCKTGKAGWCAQFFNNKNLSGTPAVTKHLTNIDQFENSGSPDPKVNIDYFSARMWSKFTVNKAENFTFSYNFDDGVRVKIKKEGSPHEYIINDWKNKSPEYKELTKYLSAGNYEIIVEYYENAGRFTYGLDISSPSVREIIFYNL